MSLVSEPFPSGDDEQTAEQALIEASRALTIHLELERVFDAILAAVETIFDARASWVLLHDPSTRIIRCLDTFGRDVAGARCPSRVDLRSATARILLLDDVTGTLGQRAPAVRAFVHGERSEWSP